MIIRMVCLFFCAASIFYGDKVDLRDYNEWNIVQLAAHFLPEDPVVVIAGGQAGETMIQMAYQWPEGRIYAFEPNPDFFSLLQQQKSWFPRSEVFPFALDHVEKDASFFLSNNPMNPRIGSLMEASPDWKWHYQDSSSHLVRCINLEKWAQEHQVNNVDFLWLNIGGAEGRVLQSIPHLIKTVQVIFIETYFQEFRQEIRLYKDVQQYLTQQGFEEIQHWKIQNFQGYALFARRKNK